MTDKLTKQEVSNYFHGPEPTLGVSKVQIIEELQQWKRKKSLSLWKETSGQLVPKRMNSVLNVNKNQLKLG